MQNGKSIVIVGAGLAGLSCGIYAQMNGYRSHIFEHDSKPGGVACAWRRGEYLVDAGIHFLFGHKPGSPLQKLYREVGVDFVECVDMENYMRFIDGKSGKRIDVTFDMEKLEEELKNISPGDAGMIGRLFSGIKIIQSSGVLWEMGMGKPPELSSKWDMVKQFWGMRRILKFFTGDFSKPAFEYARNLRNPFLAKIIENLFLPEAPVWFDLMVLALLSERQLGLLKGGCHDFVYLLVKRYESFGGVITCNSTVEEILVENGRAAGVRLSDGSRHFSDIVVSAADGYSTIFGMLRGEYTNKKIEEIYNNWRLFRPIITATFGIRGEFHGEPPLSIIMLEDPIAVGNQRIEGLSLRIFNYSDRFSPPGKTVIQVMAETEWDYWNDLQKNDRKKYDAEKERISLEILKRLERLYPGISSLLDMKDTATPYTYWRYTRNWKGSPEGWLLESKAVMTSMERTLPGLENFYMAGQWVMPGGGVPSCLYSGRHVIQILCHREGRRFKTVD